MSYFYPQAAILLNVVWEDFNDSTNESLQKLYTIPISARSVTVNINDYTQADTFSAEIDYKNFPFDPRTIRSCGVNIYMEDREKLFKSDGSLDLLVPSSKNVIFQGFVDTDKITLDENKRSVSLEGRDFTSLLIDLQYFGNPVAMEGPIGQVIQKLLLENKSTEKIIVENRTGEPLINLSSLAMDFENTSNKKNIRKDMSYWDLIQRIVNKSALIAYIELDKLVITKPQNLFSKKDTKLFVFGGNLSRLEFERKLGRMKGFNLHIMSMDIKNKTVIEAKIPEEGEDEWIKSLGIRKAPVTVAKIGADGKPLVGTDAEPAPYVMFKVADIPSKEQVIKKGQEIFETMSRQQIEGSLTTRDMKIPGNNGTCFDATQFRTAIPIEIGIDQGDLAGINVLVAKSRELQQHKGPNDEKDKALVKNKQLITNFLVSRAYEQNIAGALADCLIKINTTFYTREVELTLDQDNGFSMKIKFINFIEVSEANRK